MKSKGNKLFEKSKYYLTNKTDFIVFNLMNKTDFIDNIALLQPEASLCFELL